MVYIWDMPAGKLCVNNNEREKSMIKRIKRGEDRGAYSRLAGLLISDNEDNSYPAGGAELLSRLDDLYLQLTDIAVYMDECWGMDYEPSPKYVPFCDPDELYSVSSVMNAIEHIRKVLEEEYGIRIED